MSNYLLYTLFYLNNHFYSFFIIILSFLFFVLISLSSSSSSSSFFPPISLISQTQILNQTFLSVSRALSISRTDFLPYHKHRSSPQALIHRSSQPNFFFFTNSVDTTSFFFFAIAATSASSFVQYGFDDLDRKSVV